MFFGHSKFGFFGILKIFGYIRAHLVCKYMLRCFIICYIFDETQIDRTEKPSELKLCNIKPGALSWDFHAHSLGKLSMQKLLYNLCHCKPYKF